MKLLQQLLEDLKDPQILLQLFIFVFMILLPMAAWVWMVGSRL